MLEDLDHLYPYRQAIGFLLERAGQNSQSLTPLRDFGLKYDFFIAHGMRENKVQFPVNAFTIRATSTS